MKSKDMTGAEKHKYRASMRSRSDKQRSQTRRASRRLKRKEGTGIDIEFRIPRWTEPYPPLSWLWTETQRWVEELS